MQPTPEQVDHLVRAAVAAPSADNRCVFRWRASGDRIALIAGKELVGQPLHRRLLGLMSLGAATTNLELRARALGFAAQVTMNMSAELSGVLVDVRLTPVATTSPEDHGDSLEPELFRRCTNRTLFFRGPGVASSERALLEQTVGTEGSSRLHWLDERDLRRKALHLLAKAERQRFLREYLHRELFESIRFDIGPTETTDSGLPPGALGLPLPERLGFSIFKTWKIQQVLNRVGAHHVMAFRAADLPNRFAPHVCVISTVAPSPFIGAMLSGRALQRAWLGASSLGLAFQVFAASPIYALAGAPGIPEDTQAALALGWTELCSGGSAYIAFRIGRAPPPGIRTIRPSPSAIMA